MLVPATLYGEEIRKKISEYFYSDDMLYYTGYLGSTAPTIDSNDPDRYQYAIVDNGKLIGFFEYRLSLYDSSADCFGLFSFDRNNMKIGIDIRRELNKLINVYHIHRLSWRMIEGNPVERHYDKFCERYHGKKFVLTDVLKDRKGKYHNDVIYEIIFNH